jgi:hypothetical protein
MVAESTIRGLRYLIEHAEYLKQNSGLVAEMEFIVNLGEELGIRLGIIAEKETESSGSGGCMML